MIQKYSDNYGCAVELIDSGKICNCKNIEKQKTIKVKAFKA